MWSSLACVFRCLQPILRASFIITVQADVLTLLLRHFQWWFISNVLLLLTIMLLVGLLWRFSFQWALIFLHFKSLKSPLLYLSILSKWSSCLSTNSFRGSLRSISWKACLAIEFANWSLHLSQRWEEIFFAFIVMTNWSKADISLPSYPNFHWVYWQ